MEIRNGLIFQARGAFEKGSLFIDGDRIVADEAGRSEDTVLDASGCYVIPGLTDIHFHACMGVDFCDGTEESLRRIADYELSQGVTQICPASMTYPEEKLTEVFSAASRFHYEGGARLVGINMEGPFLSMSKKGAQNPLYIRKPDADLFFRLQRAAGGLIRLCDLAPETEGAMDFIRAVKKQVTISLAHTNCDYETAKRAYELGARHATHLYNAMLAFSHREPGLVGAACEDDRVMVELICDMVHIHPSTVRATFRMFGDDRICMISDTMEACGLEDGSYTLGGQEVVVRGKRATLKDGTIAGSVTNLMDCVRTAVKEMGIPLESAIKCAAVNPARAIGIDQDYGSLEPGRKASIVLLDQELKLVHVISDGILHI